MVYKFNALRRQKQYRLRSRSFRSNLLQKFREKQTFPVLPSMTQEQFQYLLKRYRQGLCSAEEQKLIDAWYDSIRNKHRLPLTSLEANELKNRYWDNVNGHIQRGKPTKALRKNTFVSWPAIGIAASVVVAIVAFFYISPNPTADNKVAVAVEDVKASMKFTGNESRVAKKIRLPEGSEITLQPGSRIGYLPAFNNKQREIYLEGEAFFEVKRDESRPFLVYTNEVTTKVLGTSFTIKALREDKNITVAVKTGRVSVYAHSDTPDLQSNLSETILTPNQQIVYNRTANTVSRMLVENPQAIVPVEEVKRMHFEEASVTEIFKALEKVYGVDLVFDEKLFATCTLTTSISDGEIYNRLDIICKAIGATYSVEELHIIIDGPGCN
jgi:transmembrane sensor